MIERYKKRFDEELKGQHLYEMANLSTKITGLDHGTIFVDNRTTKHGPRVKFYRDRAGKDKPSASITISRKPEVHEDNLGMSSEEKKQVFKFVIRNYIWLMEIWEKGDTMNIEEWLEGIIRI